MNRKRVQRIYRELQLASQAACIELARSGRALTLLPRSAALRACSEGRLVSRELEGTGSLMLVAVTLAEASDPLAAGLISQLSVDAANRNSGDGVHDLKRNRVGTPADVM